MHGKPVDTAGAYATAIGPGAKASAEAARARMTAALRSIFRLCCPNPWHG